MPGEYTFNSGSKVLLPVAEAIGLTLDKLGSYHRIRVVSYFEINFVFCMSSSVPLAIAYYKYLSPSVASRTTRLLVPLLLGFSMCLFCYGTACKHLIAVAFISYLLIVFSPPNHAHRAVFLFAMAYLSYIHAYRVWILREYAVDITGPMMILVQKVSSTAFSIHDGRVKLTKHEHLTQIQSREAVKDTPSLLEFLSYCFHFQSVLCGPLCFYADYISFIEGTHYESNSNKELLLNNGIDTKTNALPQPWSSVKHKIRTAVMCMVVHVVLSSYFEPSLLLEEPRQSYGFVRWYIYLTITTSLCRVPYYYAWVLADAINNASGFGFNGYCSETGEPKWDLVTNVRIKGFELADSWKSALDNWNISTMYWLRRVAYERTPKKYRTACTFLLSAWWHGFYPGYYMMFISGALVTSASRRVRRSCRHHFTSSPSWKSIYDSVTFLATKLIVPYVTFPFVFIWFWPSWNTYKQLYFSMHILCGLAVAVLPLIVPPQKPTDHQKEQ